MINVDLLRYAVAAADTGSFSRAATRFGVKQSTLSKRIQFLENGLGLPLFRRSTRGVAPTESGAHVLSRARRILEDIDTLAGEARALSSGETGTLKIGFHGSLVGGDLSAAIHAFRAACPDIEIQASQRGRHTLVAALQDGALDAAVLAGQTLLPSLRSLCFWSEPVTISLPADHALAAREPLYWTDLREAIFLVTASDPGPDLRAMVMARLSVPGHHPTVLVQDVGRENLPSLIGGTRIAITAGVILLADQTDGSVCREIHDASGHTCLEQGVYWKVGNGNPALRRFLELLAHRYARIVPAI
ncbi:LysR family transcriptional regulator [Sphingomonas glacialis]|uniref:LysR family transcriptional regulator n=1 Tax=Sphingomonas glacialis TaxID=658225 RepID=A0ABQ3LRU8_9SPHN|nr:LysR family transcriptional regulator [Sphingomonas glacialis]GHH24117.1 LysR family transcriptional regulator [Sphingomonas glacialis]